MHAKDRFLIQLFERADGRTDRTFHSHLHIAGPLGLSRAEARASVAVLLREGLIAADPMFDRLIALTPAGIAACTRRGTDMVVHEQAVIPERREGVLALHEIPAYADAQPVHG
jgi:hypothetical protein